MVKMGFLRKEFERLKKIEKRVGFSIKILHHIVV
jgi:hypothetical protein